MADLPKHSVSVAGIVFNEKGEVLVVKRRDNGEWQPPGGVLEVGETITEGLRREILEETGVEVQVGRVTGVYKNTELGVLAVVLKCTHPVGKPRTSNETEEVQWIKPHRAMKVMTPVFAARVDDATQTLVGAAQRTHDGRRFYDER